MCYARCDSAVQKNCSNLLKPFHTVRTPGFNYVIRIWCSSSNREEEDYCLCNGSEVGLALTWNGSSFWVLKALRGGTAGWSCPLYQLHLGREAASKTQKWITNQQS